MSFKIGAIEEYSEPGTRKTLEELDWGMSMQNTEEFLNKNGILYSMLPPDDKYSIEIDNSRYFLAFNQEKRLTEIYLQQGGSRNRRFTIGMTREEIEEKAGCDLVAKNNNVNEDIYVCQEPVDKIYYGFVMYNNRLSGIFESETRLE